LDEEEEIEMKATLIALGALAAAALVAPGASAQDANLSGQYQCVSGCGGAGLAIVTQNGWDLNLVNDAGIPTRAWIDWPGHIWADAWQLGAIFSPDGLTIQFDNGIVWQRFIPQPILRSRG
jgi:hypothetical protein